MTMHLRRSPSAKISACGMTANGLHMTTTLSRVDCKRCKIAAAPESEADPWVEIGAKLGQAIQQTVSAMAAVGTATAKIQQAAKDNIEVTITPDEARAIGIIVQLARMQK